MRFWASFLVMLLVVVFAASSVKTGLAVTGLEASEAVSGANQALQSAFDSVVEAEKSGANVSVLLVKLNNAGSNLTVAEEALAAGNYSDAAEFAGNCGSLADGVKNDAGILKADADAASALWWMTVAFSAAGSAVFAVLLLLVWHWFKESYLRKVLRSRPMVVG